MKQIPMVRRKIGDLSGKKFGMLTAISRVEGHKKHTRYNVVCDCGKAKEVAGLGMFSGRIKSCGCNPGNKGKNITTHGLSRENSKPTRLYRIWCLLRSRCSNPNDSRYEGYGGRGIAVSEEWDDYTAFHKWAMTHGYRDDLTIERKNNDFGYYPDNCTWATWRDQSRNKRSTIYTPAKVIRVREFFRAGVSAKELVVMYGGSVASVYRIVKRESWSDIKGRWEL